MKKPSEHKIQSALFKWASLSTPAKPELRLLFAIPNGGNRDPITGALMKREGARAGVPDVMLPVARGKWHGLFIEMKKPGGRTSIEQRGWIAELQREGYAVCVCYSLQEAIDVIDDYISYDPA